MYSKKTKISKVIITFFALFLFGCFNNEPTCKQIRSTPITKKQIGEQCQLDLDCLEGRCINYICLKENGDTCSNNEECFNMNCINNICAQCISDNDCDFELKCYENKCKQYCPSESFEVDVCLPVKPNLPDCLYEPGGCAKPNMPDCLFEKGGCSGFDKCLFDENINCIDQDLPDCITENCYPKSTIPVELSNHNDWECPVGWNAIAAFEDSEIINPGAVDELKLEPFNFCKPPEMPEVCNSGFMQVVGRDECVKMGEVCPENDWAEENLIRNQAQGFDGNIIYVKPGNNAGNYIEEGTRQAPYLTINAAINECFNKDIIALSKGDYIENLIIEKEIAIIGACTEKSIITSLTATQNNTVITVTGNGGTVINNITVKGEAAGIEVNSNEKTAFFNAIEVQNTVTSGLTVKNKGIAEFFMLKILNTQAVPDDEYPGEYFGQGIKVIEGSTLTGSSVYLGSNENVGIFAIGSEIDTDNILESIQPVKLFFTDLVVIDTKGVGPHYSGAGIVMVNEVKAEFDRCIINENTDGGITAYSENSELSLKMSNIVVEKTKCINHEGAFGSGIELDGNIEVFMENIYLFKNSETALVILNNNLSGTDEIPAVVIKNIIAADSNYQRFAESFGRGIEINSVSKVSIENGYLARNTDAGLYVSSPYSDEWYIPPKINVKDLTVIDTGSSGENTFYGYGMELGFGTSAIVENTLLLRNQTVGLFIYAIAADFKNLTVVDTKSDEAAKSYGTGIEISNGADTNFKNLLVARNRTTGVLIYSQYTKPEETQTKAVLNNAMVIDTYTQEKDGTYGRGIEIDSGANVNLIDCFIGGNKDAGVFISSVDKPEHGFLTEVGIKNCAVINTKPEEYNYDLYGIGFVVSGGAQVTSENLYISNNTGVGLLVESLLGEPLENRTKLKSKNLSVVDTKPTNGNELHGEGKGIYLQRGPFVKLENSFIARSTRFGVLANTTDSFQNREITPTELEITNMIIEDTKNPKGVGFTAVTGTQILGKNIHISASRAVGMIIQSNGTNDSGIRTEAFLENVSILDSRSEISSLRNLMGIGLSVGSGSKIVLNKAYIAGNSKKGIEATSANSDFNIIPDKKTELYLEDVEITNVKSNENHTEEEFIEGFGLSIKSGTYSEIKRLHLSNYQYSALYISSENIPESTDLTESNIFDITIENTVAISLEEDENHVLTGGTGLTILNNTNVNLNRFLIQNNNLAGINIIKKDSDLIGKLNASEGIIKNNMFGVNIQLNDFNIYDTFTNVASFNNEVDFDARDLPVPNSSEIAGQYETIKDSAVNTPVPGRDSNRDGEDE